MGPPRPDTARGMSGGPPSRSSEARLTRGASTGTVWSGTSAKWWLCRNAARLREETCQLSPNRSDPRSSSPPVRRSSSRPLSARAGHSLSTPDFRFSRRIRIYLTVICRVNWKFDTPWKRPIDGEICAPDSTRGDDPSPDISLQRTLRSARPQIDCRR